MDTILRTLVVLLLTSGLVFFIFAWAKGWLKGAGTRGSFTSQVIMHDMLNQSKQNAMEYVIDEEEEKEKKDAFSGEDKEPGYEGKEEDETPQPSSGD